MFEHILIPTDGSDLSKDAVQYGIAVAKAANAKVTGITVSTPFHVLALNPDMLTDTSESYKKRMTTIATKYPRTGEERCSRSRCKLRYSPCRARASFPSYY
jgi:nucleotide-binding universal stress UspA family protein